ncbi:MAG TPA: aspartate/glutamate racemase family protein [Casimicrobiaceae bacterium]|nr:aspartate/glutamate racemase family protein [Casimicrobiaceae bacterium]
MQKRASVLAINPNTSLDVTDLLARTLRNAMSTIDWRMATGRFGANYILSEAASVIAAHAAIEAWASQAEDCNAVLLACFGDPGLFALRELSAVPVVGLAEASMDSAAQAGRFSIVTGGSRWPAMLERLAQALGHGGKLIGTRTIGITGAQVAAQPDRAAAMLAAACRDAKDNDGADAVILGGAAFAGLSERVCAIAGIPVIDSVLAGAQAAAALAFGATPRYERASGAMPTPSSGLAVALADKLLE